MTLELAGIDKVVGGETHLADIDLTLEPGSLNVLLGPTLAGKTSIMRIMAGLDKPSRGTVRVDGADVAKVPVRKRDVAMVYQQFINYPTLTVYANIASPLQIAGWGKAAIDARVREVARLLKLEGFLDRTPLALSGGQQQRTALARALAKNARLVLLDEPLANLDYKLREELREELPRIFAESGAIFVYATTEPAEALLLGGKTATLHQGRVTRFADTLSVYRWPGDLATARVFADPPINTLDVMVADGRLHHSAGLQAPLAGPVAQLPEGAYTIGFRAQHLGLERPHSEALAVRATVRVAELTGSESFIHMVFGDVPWVAVAHGIHDVPVDSEITVYLDPYRFMVFDGAGRQVAGPHAAAEQVA